MAFEFWIPVDSVFDSVFPSIRHLNWMDKITSHIIQMNLNPQSLNSRISDVRASNSKSSDSKVSEASDTWVSEASDSRASKVSNRALGLKSFHLGGSGPESFSGFDFPGLWLRPVSYWASERLIHDPTITLQFPCLKDYGNFPVPEEWIKFFRPTPIPGHGGLCRFGQVRDLVEKVNFD